jgi:hypothetical protein
MASIPEKIAETRRPLANNAKTPKQAEDEKDNLQEVTRGEAPYPEQCYAKPKAMYYRRPVI